MADSPRAMPFLVVRQPDRVDQVIELRDGFIIGRDAECDLVLADAKASRRHARFAGGAIEDLGSTHGTYVGGAKIDGRRPLAEGAAIQIGSAVLFYRADDPSDVLHSASVRTAPAPASSAERRLAVLYDVARVVGAIGDPDQLAAQVCTTTLEVLDAERVVLQAGRRHVVLRAGAAPDEVAIGRTVLAALLDRRESVLLRARDAGVPPSMISAGVRSAMGAPLVAGDRVLGFIYVDDRRRADHFTEAELDFLTALAHLAAAALEQAEERHHDARLAAVIRDQPIPTLLGDSPAMRAVVDRVHKFARADAPVLVRGETGTGKELVARALHALSPRADEPFVAVNCAAIPDTMIESELFGHKKGAFTGATADKRGKLALAHRGTLFLDEIGDLSLGAQAKVLRALEDGEIHPLGAEAGVKVDVRLVSATHVDLETAVEAGRFRRDLYYRIAVGEIAMPPLRDRGDDVVLLAEQFLARAAAKLGRPLVLTADGRAALTRYGWPGNVRQLRNEVERAALLADGDRIAMTELAARTAGATASGPAPTGTLAERFAQLEVTERELVKEALARASGNLAQAARQLGITRIMLKRRADRFAATDAAIAAAADPDADTDPSTGTA